jgi:hypothetical protein
MKTQRFIVHLVAIADSTASGEWVSFRHPHPDVLHAFRFEDNSAGDCHPPAVVTISPDRIAVYDYYGAHHPSIYDGAHGWDALRRIEQRLGIRDSYIHIPK